jgi:outer membrane protein assembly factor BamB
MRLSLLLAFVVACLTSWCAAEDWTQFRGPTGQGHATAKNLPTTWSETENVTWKTPLPGKGWSSPVLFGNQIWVTSAEEVPETPERTKERLAANTGNQPLDLAAEASFYAVCLDKTTGKIVQQLKLFTEKEPQWVHRMNSFASPTPILTAGRLYCHFGASGTACVDTQTHKVLWLNQEHKINHENGPGGSPVLHNDLLIFHCDGSDTQYITALNVQTGKTAWKTERTGKMNENPQLRKAYGTPLLANVAGQDILISPAADWMYAYDPTTGKELWKYSYETLGFSIVPRPVIDKGILYYCTSFMQSELQAVQFDPNQANVAPKFLWREKKSIPRMPSPIVVENRIYLVSDDGGVLSCLNATTGELVYRERIDGKHCASPLFADGKLYFCDREGTTVVLQPGDTLQVVAKNKLEGAIMASPAAVDNALFIRTEHALYRLENK